MPATNAGASSKGLAKRVIACLDVRANDKGDLVVTKVRKLSTQSRHATHMLGLLVYAQGDQYDVRDKGGAQDVRNLGKPVELAAHYFEEGADEISFLNITGKHAVALAPDGGTLHKSNPDVSTRPGMPCVSCAGFRESPLTDLPMLEVLKRVRLLTL